MEVHKYYLQYETLGVVVAIGEKCYAIEGKSESEYIKVYTLVNTSGLVTLGQEIQKYNKSAICYFQCVVSDGHTSTLAVVNGINVNIIESIKARDLVKKKLE